MASFRSSNGCISPRFDNIFSNIANTCLFYDALYLTPWGQIPTISLHGDKSRLSHSVGTNPVYLAPWGQIPSISLHWEKSRLSHSTGKNPVYLTPLGQNIQFLKISFMTSSLMNSIHMRIKNIPIYKSNLQFNRKSKIRKAYFCFILKTYKEEACSISSGRIFLDFSPR